MPHNRLYYNTLTVHAFRDHICEWIEGVHDCCILHSSSLDTRYQKFKNTNLFPLSFESDEEDDDNIKETLDNPTVDRTTDANTLYFSGDESFATPEKENTSNKF